ncbi:hypothetical protein CYMTET_26039 [Cymbomonas tetramitiformis]|uniref:Uncharacterized protein n=1 Tax=Cymbomonas tetramitiformis TaxID=36881 RepID=A0AAE0KYK5_9CHLO|nr:hypothetical protein CYMTET_26039 [Cymbomonas tetramitiformis]
MVHRVPSGTPPSPGEKRSGKLASVPPSPPRSSKRMKSAEQRDSQAEDIADLEHEDPSDEADGLDAGICDKRI